MQYILIFLVPLLVIFSSTAFLATIFKKRFGVMLPIYLMSMALFEYICMLFSGMMFGIWVIALFALALPILLTYRCLHDKKPLKKQLKKIFSPSAKIFLIIYFIIFCLNIWRHFSMWDEFMHWGPFVKEIVRLRDFYTSTESSIRIHADYPPIVSVFQSVWCILTGGYKEATLYIATQLLGLSFFMPFIAKIKWGHGKKFWRRLAHLLVVVLVIPLMVALEDCIFYETILLDGIVACEFAYGLASIFLEKKYDRFFFARIAMLLCFMVLTKQICIILTLALLLYLLVSTVMFRRSLKIIAPLTISLVLPIISYISWGLQVAKTTTIVQFSVRDIFLALQTLIEHPFDEEMSFASYVFSKFSEALLDSGIVLGFSFIFLLLLLPLGMRIIFRYFKIKSSKKQRRSLIIILEISAIAYASVIFALYLTSFMAYEVDILAGYKRYVGSFWLGAMMCMALIVISKRINKYPLLHGWYYWLFIAIFIFSIQIDNKSKIDYRAVDESVAYLSQLKSDSKVYIIDQHVVRPSASILLQYHLLPIKMNNPMHGSEPPSLGQKQDLRDSFTRDIPPSEWLGYLNENDYDYVYILNSDDGLKEDYGEIFSVAPESGDLYIVTSSLLIKED